MRLGNTSLTLLQHLVNSETREVKASCATVTVNMAPETNQPSPIPQVWRDAIVAHEGHEYKE
jgi:acyl-CoA thioester hydrolase